MATSPPPGYATDPWAAAQAQVDAEIAAQTGGLQSDVAGEQQAQTNALANLRQMYSTLEPFVTQNADRTQAAGAQTGTAIRGVFDAAGARLNSLRQQQASEAQDLAQRMGGPVDVSVFSGATDAQAQVMPHLGVNAELKALTDQSAASDAMREFAGKVFPELGMEQTRDLQTSFGQNIKKLQDSIRDIKAQRPGLLSERYSNLLEKKHTYDLQTQQLALDRLKANRDWQATRRSLGQEKRRLDMAERQQKKAFALEEAGVTGKYKGKTTQQAAERKQSAKQWYAQYGLSQAQVTGEYAGHPTLAMKEAEANRRTAKQKTATDTKVYAGQLIDAAVSGKPGSTVSQAYYQPVTDLEASGLTASQVIKKGGYPVRVKGRDGQTHTVWMLPAKRTVEYGGTAPIRDPNRLTDYLVAHGVPQRMAVVMVRRRLGKPNWVYGQGSGKAHGNAYATKTKKRG